MSRVRPAWCVVTRDISARPDDGGFSIVEALVALAVFAMAGVGLVQLQTYSLSTLIRVERNALALMVAQNQLVAALSATKAPDLGASQGETRNAGRTWRWQMRVIPTEDAALRRISVSVAEYPAVFPPVSVHAFRASGPE